MRKKHWHTWIIMFGLSIAAGCAASAVDHATPAGDSVSADDAHGDVSESDELAEAFVAALGQCAEAENMDLEADCIREAQQPLVAHLAERLAVPEADRIAQRALDAYRFVELPEEEGGDTLRRQCAHMAASLHFDDLEYLVTMLSRCNLEVERVTSRMLYETLLQQTGFGPLPRAPLPDDPDYQLESSWDEIQQVWNHIGIVTCATLAKPETAAQAHTEQDLYERGPSERGISDAATSALARLLELRDADGQPDPLAKEYFESCYEIHENLFLRMTKDPRSFIETDEGSAE